MVVAVVAVIGSGGRCRQPQVRPGQSGRSLKTRSLQWLEEWEKRWEGELEEQRGGAGAGLLAGCWLVLDWLRCNQKAAVGRDEV